jgi:hypothetical protein
MVADDVKEININFKEWVPELKNAGETTFELQSRFKTIMSKRYLPIYKKMEDRIAMIANNQKPARDSLQKAKKRMTVTFQKKPIPSKLNNDLFE